MRRRQLLVLGVLIALLAASCGGTKDTKDTAGGTTTGSSATPTPSGACASAGESRFAKARFILHAGIAFGAFHRYIYKPYRAGAFKAGAPGRAKALAKAGASALVVAHEVKAARDAAAGDATLCKLVAPLDSLNGLATTLAPGLKSGSFNPTQLLDLNKRIEDFKSSTGTQIPER